MKDGKIHGESKVWSANKDIKRSTDLMFILGLKETIDKLVMANSVRWYGHVLRIEDDHILRKPIDFEVEGKRKKGRPKGT